MRVSVQPKEVVVLLRQLSTQSSGVSRSRSRTRARIATTISSSATSSTSSTPTIVTRTITSLTRELIVYILNLILDILITRDKVLNSLRRQSNYLRLVLNIKFLLKLVQLSNRVLVNIGLYILVAIIEVSKDLIIALLNIYYIIIGLADIVIFTIVVIKIGNYLVDRFEVVTSIDILTKV